MTATIEPAVPVHYIQGLRLVHALAEGSIPVALPTGQRARLRLLSSKFGAQFRRVDQGTRPLHGLGLAHPLPETRIGRIVRPLIFPHAIVDHCRSLWRSPRPTRFAFAGLVTDRRGRLLRDWITRHFPAYTSTPFPAPGRVRRAWEKIRIRLGAPPAGSSCHFGELLLWSSERGRVFPWKAWDDDYFRLLARSEFVLCPSGDFIWSYRFFEAVLCGAIPIVEEICPAYAGFRFHTFADDARALVWDEPTAAANFALARDRLTVPTTELDAEVRHLLAA
ncbi:MAG: exostosin family protein [Opitutaceae bacterium]